MEIQDLLTAFSAVIIAMLTWFFNEQSKRADDLYKQKDSRYLELIQSLKSFYVESPTPEPGDYELSEKKLKNKQLLEEFMNQIHLCWLYCSDEVIRKAHGFLLAAQKDHDQRTHAETERAAGELMVAIRRDMDRNSFDQLFRMWGKKNTRLTPEDFRYMEEAS
jgi:hypothetical protein